MNASSPTLFSNSFVDDIHSFTKIYEEDQNIEEEKQNLTCYECYEDLKGHLLYLFFDYSFVDEIRQICHLITEKKYHKLHFAIDDYGEELLKNYNEGITQMKEEKYNLVIPILENNMAILEKKVNSVLDNKWERKYEYKNTKEPIINNPENDIKQEVLKLNDPPKSTSLSKEERLAMLSLTVLYSNIVYQSIFFNEKKVAKLLEMLIILLEHVQEENDRQLVLIGLFLTVTFVPEKAFKVLYYQNGIHPGESILRLIKKSSLSESEDISYGLSIAIIIIYNSYLAHYKKYFEDISKHKPKKGTIAYNFWVLLIMVHMLENNENVKKYDQLIRKILLENMEENSADTIEHSNIICINMAIEITMRIQDEENVDINSFLKYLQLEKPMQSIEAIIRWFLATPIYLENLEDTPDQLQQSVLAMGTTFLNQNPLLVVGELCLSAILSWINFVQEFIYLEEEKVPQGVLTALVFSYYKYIEQLSSGVYKTLAPPTLKLALIPLQRSFKLYDEWGFYEHNIAKIAKQILSQSSETIFSEDGFHRFMFLCLCGKCDPITQKEIIQTLFNKLSFPKYQNNILLQNNLLELFYLGLNEGIFESPIPQLNEYCLRTANGPDGELAFYCVSILVETSMIDKSVHFDSLISILQNIPKSRNTIIDALNILIFLISDSNMLEKLEQFTVSFLENILNSPIQDIQITNQIFEIFISMNTFGCKQINSLELCRIFYLALEKTFQLMNKSNFNEVLNCFNAASILETESDEYTECLFKLADRFAALIQELPLDSPEKLMENDMAMVENILIIVDFFQLYLEPKTILENHALFCAQVKRLLQFKTVVEKSKS